MTSVTSLTVTFIGTSLFPWTNWTRLCTVSGFCGSTVCVSRTFRPTQRPTVLIEDFQNCKIISVCLLSQCTMAIAANVCFQMVPNADGFVRLQLISSHAVQSDSWQRRSLNCWAHQPSINELPLIIIKVLCRQTHNPHHRKMMVLLPVQHHPVSPPSPSCSSHRKGSTLRSSATKWGKRVMRFGLLSCKSAPFTQFGTILRQMDSGYYFLT